MTNDRRIGLRPLARAYYRWCCGMSDVKCFMLDPTGETRRSGDGLTSWPMYRRADTGEEMTFADAPPGAMIDMVQHRPNYKSVAGPDGRYLMVKLPNERAWCIDDYCNNCTRKGEDHDCWCRHGEPPNITVDKTPEPGRTTCSAGGGSIQAGDWHGFLRDGFLTLG